jgi:hypothetical protein
MSPDYIDGDGWLAFLWFGGWRLDALLLEHLRNLRKIQTDPRFGTGYMTVGNWWKIAHVNATFGAERITSPAFERARAKLLGGSRGGVS